MCLSCRDSCLEYFFKIFFYFYLVTARDLQISWQVYHLSCFSLHGRRGEAGVLCPEFHIFSKAEFVLCCQMMQQGSRWEEVVIPSCKLKNTSFPNAMHELHFGIISDTVNTRMRYKWEHVWSHWGGLLSVILKYVISMQLWLMSQTVEKHC